MKTKPLEKSAPASAASDSASSKPDGKPSGKSNSTMSTGLCLPIDFLTLRSSKTSEIGDHIPCPKFPASLLGSLARTSASWQTLREINRDAVLRDSAAGCSFQSWKSSAIFGPNGWQLKMCRPCSVQTIAKTFRRSSGNLPSAGMWDSGACLTLNISECPKDASASSWSRVLDATPQWTSWLTPSQWRTYLARLDRNASARRRMLGLAILLRLQRKVPILDTEKLPHGTIWAVNFSLLRKTDGIRCLSGSERLSYMGFDPGWMRSTLKRLMPLAMHSPPQWRNGLLKF